MLPSIHAEIVVAVAIFSTAASIGTNPLDREVSVAVVNFTDTEGVQSEVSGTLVRKNVSFVSEVPAMGDSISSG